MRLGNKTNRKIKLYGLIRKKKLAILTLEKSKKFKDFLSNVFGSSYCEECMQIDVEKQSDVIYSELGHLVHQDSKISGEIVYGKDRIFLFLDLTKSGVRILDKMQRSAKWVKSDYQKPHFRE